MKHRLLTCLLVLMSSALFSQVITPFTIRYQATQKGGIRYISNTATTCSGIGCGAGRTEVPPAGTSSDNGFTAAYVDVDADGSTFQSSSDSLALPTCSQISWAGLYWGGENTTGGSNYATRNQCKIKLNNGAYLNLTADQLQDNAVGFDTYHCFKDITAFVQAAGTNGRFTVANVAARVGGTNRFGGWTIVVVYKNDLQPMRNLTVFNGLSNVSGANPVTDITVSGFLTPLSGPVTFEVGNVTYDGDRSSTGDQLMFNGGSGFVNISDAVNPLNDIFNSTYSYNGVQKTTPFINPGYTNSLGFDADIFIPNNAAKNYIGNSATSATLRLTTGGETFLTQVVTMAIDVYEPDLRAACRVLDLNGGSVLPGDILEYTIVGKNIGSDPSVNTFITDTLERNAVYIPGTLSITYGPGLGAKTDASADDQGEYIAALRTIRVRVGSGAGNVSGGQMNNSPLGVDSTQIKFRAMATTDCIILQCDNIINNRAYIFGTGNVSGNSWSNGSNPDIFDGSGCPVPGTTNTPISAASCSPPSASSNSPVCTGNTISLTTSPASSVATYSWTGPGGFVSTAASPTRANATAAMAGTYTCVITVPSSACSFTVTTVVVVNTTPATPSPSSNSPVCTGNTISLSTTAVAGATYSWTGPSAFASALQNPTRASATVAMAGTYSVTVTANGCTSAVGTTVVVVNTTPATPTASSNTPVCTGNTINLSTPAVAGATYSWTGPSAFASALQNPTRTSATVAMAGTYSVTVTTNGCTSGVGTTAVVINATPATPTASSNTPVCSGNTINLSTPAVAGATYSWTGPNSFASSVQNPSITNATIAMAGTYSVTVTTNGCTSGIGTTAVVVNATPATPTASSNSPVCTGNTINLSTPAVAGATYSWTGPNSFVSSVQNPTITNATLAMAGTYSVTVTTNGCTSAVGTTAVVINATPATPTASSNSPVCSGNTINLSTPAVAGATYSWTGPNSFVSSVQNPSITNATVAMAGTYSVTVTTTGCTSGIGTTAVVVNATPATPTASSNSPVCAGSTINLSTPAVAGATYSWTGPNSFVSSVQNPSITNATVAMAGTYSVTVTTNGCTSAIGTTVVTVTAPPTTSAAGTDQTICANSTTMAANTAAVGTGTWTQISGPVTATITTPGSPTTTITGITTAGTYVFQWTITNAPCSASSDQVQIIRSGTPTTAAAGLDQTICTTVGAATMTGNTAVVGTGAWSQISGPVTATITTPGSPVTTITGLTTAGTYVFQWTISNSPCTPSSDQISVIVNAPPTVSAAGPDQTICSNTATMAANTATSGTGTWTQISGPVIVTITTPGSPTTTITGITVAGTYVFQWTITNAPCTASSDQVQIIRNATTPTSNAGPDQALCSVTSALMAANVATPGTGVWTEISGPNIAAITLPNSPVTTMTGLIAGTYVFQWTITNPPCTPTTDQVSIVISSTPTTAAAGPDQSLCAVTSTTMAANTATSGTGAWSQIGGPNTATITTPSSPTTTMTGLIPGTYTFQWTISNAPCVASSDQVQVVIFGAPTTSNAGTDQTICTTTGSAIMAANVATTGTGAWTQISGPVTATIVVASSPITGITGLTTAGTYVFQWTISNGVCTPSSDQVSVIVNDPPTVSAAGNDQSLCNVTMATMAANAATSGAGAWTQISGPNTPTITAPASETTTMTGLVAGTYIFQWTISNAPCASSSDQVQITVFDLPTVADAGADQTLCNATSATMAGNAATTGIGTWTQASGPNTATIVLPASETTSITGLIPGTYVFVWTITNGVCAATTDSVNIMIDPLPTTSAAGSDQINVCPPLITMAANAATTGTAIWTQASGPNTATITTPGSETTTISGLTPGTYVFVWTISSGICASSSDSVTITVVSCDNDNDGIADNVDPDDDNDGIPDITEGPGDTDGDGIPDYYDLDSDNDGITDVAEAGGSDPDGDGIIGAGPFVDTDGDGLGDLVDPDNGGTPLVVVDTDGDGIPNIHDLDSDNDGITDVTEAGGVDANGDGIIDGYTDTDGDGLSDNVDTNNGGTMLAVPDSDGDGHADYTDLDSDNDGITDVTEAGGTDANGDGFIDGYTDTDNDGLSDNVDTNNGGTMLTNPDPDGDGVNNYLDLDSDNDGITDVTEAGGTDANGDGMIDGFTDTDNDGLSDNVDTNNGGTMLTNPDSDGDGHPNYLDLDSDNDGIPDVTEAGGTDTNGDGIIDTFADANGNGLSDNVDPSTSGTPLIVADNDGDGLDNYIDLDSDNDGSADVVEAGGIDANGDGIIDGYADTDNDGLSDNVDSNNGGTPLLNVDTDGDGIHNYLDLDSDNDGITDVAENGGADADGNGMIDGFTDANNDGFADSVEPSQGGTTLATLDNDGDGHPNYLDLDSDNDGILDIIETGGTDADGNGQVDAFTDSNNNGLADSVDPVVGGTPNFTTGPDANADGRPDAYPNDNADANGLPNFLDIDSDNDGIVDNIEGQTSAGYIAPTGTDSDNDGIDDAYDNFVGFGGAGVTPTNTDGADTPDYIDTDADNDTFPDAIEGWDTNNDGTADTTPSGVDADNDGLDDAYDTNTSAWNPTNGQTPTSFTNLDNSATPELDWRESEDNDGDGIVNALDPDDDNDGILDTTEGTVDTDGDGIIDAYDLDSDNDGIADVIESGGTDPDGDGIIGSGPIADTDNDGLSDLVDLDNGGTPLVNIDTDNDGNPNYIDLDSDNDGITDVTEAGGTDANGDGIIDGYADTDGDGLSDNVDSNNGGTPLLTPDTDGDGASNYADLDSDNDGLGDVTEAGGTDTNGDGIIDGFVDTDNDGLSDNVDTNNGGTMLTNPDTDGDGVHNYLDLDSDNDGISDVSESGNGALDANNDGIVDGTDTDGDGIVNATGIDNNSTYGGTNVSSTPDADGDGVDNYLDLDSDNDGISDVTESGHAALDANNDGVVDGTDTDGDGIINVNGIDSNSTFGGNNLGGNDFDGDGIANQNDLDSDNDGITDVIESGNGALDANNDGIVDGTDADGDGLLSSVDNNITFGGQPTTPVNTDSNGNPDYLDIDADNDGIVDNVEAQTTIGYVAPSGTDSDNDGLDDAYDTTVGFGGAGVTPTNTDAADAPDYLDLDSDNDSIVDAIEGWDTDGNGSANTVPSGSDSDNDGLDDAYDVNDASVNPTNGTTPSSYPDLINPGGDRDWRDVADNDGDGISNVDDIDDDNDGILDTTETAGDFDGDGIPNWFDLDSDNDGIPDVVEGGSPDTNNDGLVDNFTDTNNDGYDDAVAAATGNAGPPVTDADNDGHPDYLDLDSDNDGIADVIEGGSPDANNDGVVDNFTDADHNGFDDTVENGTGIAGPAVPDFDNDGVPDYHDLDSDNDGITDVVEGGSPDTNGDGLIDNFTDADGNGWDDNVENGNGNAGPPVPDTDGDGLPDYHDLDSDNDGIPDVVEGGSPDTDGNGLVDNFTDTDGDGWDDNVENGTGNPGPAVTDNDNDGVPDYLDLDSDNDGIVDAVEGGGTDTNGDGIIDNFTDADGDGWDDNTENGNGNAGPPVPDYDGDGIPDYHDLDSDNDGIPDVLEGGSPDVDGNGTIDNFTDNDGDGWDDNVENSSGNPGPDVPDTDGDGIPDYHDLDSDNDGIPDVVEGGSPDVDGNGTIDNFTDNDGDGWDDNVENGSGNPGPDVADTDGDGVPDYLDLDSDGDGITDAIEGGGVDANGDGIIDNFTDADGDGWDDNTENGSGNPGPAVPDTDGDGIPDYLDIDSDGDGINDGTGNELTSLDCDEDGISNYLDPDPCGLVIPQGFSPNGDGINDIFELKGISAYPDNKVTIFNRWGNLVYEAAAYDNGSVSWDGTNSGNLSTGSGPLPEGTYFYVIDLGDGSPVLSGYVFVNRQ